MDENKLEKKKVFLECLKKVNALNERSVKIATEMNMHNLKLIERSSKCVKDPNPLASTMSLMNQKYPLAVNKSAAKTYNMPKDFFPKVSSEDSHKHGYILCKKEAIEWWINSENTMDQNEIETINIIMKQSRKDVKAFYSFKWQNSRVKWGIPVIERKMVPSRQPTVDIPRHLREDALKEVLFKEYTLPSTRLTDLTINKLEDCLKLTLSNKLGLSKQIRIVLNELDPKEKYSPILSGLDQSVLVFKHAIHHGNFVLDRYIDSKKVSEKDVMMNLIGLFTRSLIYESADKRYEEATIDKIIKRTKINRVGYRELIDQNTFGNDFWMKWIKVKLGYPINTEVTKSKLTVCPILKQLIPTSIVNKTNYMIRVYNNVITCNFKMNNMRGSFSYTRGTLTELITNFTTGKSLSALLVEIAVYIKWYGTDTKGTTDKEVDLYIRDMATKNPFQVAGLDRKNFKRVINGEIKEIGCLRIQDTTEYQTTGEFDFAIDGNMDLVCSSFGYSIKNNERKPQEDFPDEIECGDFRMANYFSFKRLTKFLLAHYLNNFHFLIDEARKMNFGWYNESISRHMGDNRKSVSQLCRMIINNMISNDELSKSLLCLMYMFSGPDPGEANLSSTTFYNRRGEKIDLSGNEGIFLFDETKGTYMLYGVAVGEETEKIEKCKMITGILDSFELLENSPENLMMRSVRWLESHKDTIKEGSRYKTYFCGALYIAVKNSYIKHGTRLTYQRQISNYNKEYRDIITRISLGKRPYMESETPSVSTIIKKVKTLEDDEDILYDDPYEDINAGGVSMEMDMELETLEEDDMDLV